MFDETEEDEANECEIRRIRREQLFRRPKPKLPEQQGDVMERREQFDWTYEVYNGKHGIFEGNLLVAVVGECFARPEQVAELAQSIADDHNQHTALVEQRDRLVAVARAVVKKYEGNFAVPFDEAELLDMAMNALATVEQGEGTPD